MARHARCSDASSVYHVLNRAVGRALSTADGGSIGPGILRASPGKAGESSRKPNLTPFLLPTGEVLSHTVTGMKRGVAGGSVIN